MMSLKGTLSPPIVFRLVGLGLAFLAACGSDSDALDDATPAQLCQSRTVDDCVQNSGPACEPLSVYPWNAELGCVDFQAEEVRGCVLRQSSTAAPVLDPDQRMWLSANGEIPAAWKEAENTPIALQRGESCTGSIPPGLVCAGSLRLTQEQCRTRPLEACDVDCDCRVSFAFAIDPDTLCVEGTGVSMPFACDLNGDLDGVTTVVDPDGGLWNVSSEDLPESWSYPAEPIDLKLCDNGALAR